MTPRKVRDVIVQTWQSEANLTLFLALLVLFVFVLPSIGLQKKNALLYGTVVTTLMLISGVAMTWRRRPVFFLASSVAIAALVVRWAELLRPPGAIGIWPEVANIAAILMLLYIVLSHVFASGPVTPMRIQGAIAAYLLFGIGWANAYAVVASTIPGSFSVPRSGVSSAIEWFYFSFVTLTTLGFGDIVPTHPIARSLTIGEVLTGQLYLAVLIGRLVGMQISSGVSPSDGGSIR